MLSPCSLLISKNLHAFKHMVVTQDAFQAVYFSFIKLFLLSPSYEKAKKKKKKRILHGIFNCTFHHYVLMFKEISFSYIQSWLIS